MNSLPTVSLLGIPVTSASESEILEFLLKRLHANGEKTVIFTPNPEIVMLACRDAEYRKVLVSAQVLLADGVGLLWGAYVLGKRLKKRIPGVDFMREACRMSAKEGLTVGFVGGRGGVAEKTAERLKKSYQNLTVVYAGDDPDDFLQSGKHAEVLFVALGAPKQEMWIAEHLDELSVRVVMGVGGAFDFVSGRVGRAPKWIRSLGLEWLYRLVRQPWRWRRQLLLVEFIYVVFKTRIFGQKSNTS